MNRLPTAAALFAAVLATVLDTLLKLLHPVMPFVTDVLWKALTGGEGTYTMDLSHYDPVPPNVQEEMAKRYQVREDD